MKTWGGTDKRDPDAITRIDYFLRDVNAAMQRITAGQIPTGGGGAIGGVTDHGALTGLTDDDHAQYLLLAGRSGGQIVLSTATTDPVLTINGLTNQSGSHLTFRTNSVLNGGITKDSDAADTALVIYGSSANNNPGLWLYGKNAATAPRILLEPLLNKVDIFSSYFDVYNSTGNNLLLRFLGGSATFKTQTIFHQTAASFGPYPLVIMDNEETIADEESEPSCIIRRGGKNANKQTSDLIQFRTGSSETAPDVKMSYISYDGVFHGVVDGGLPDHTHAATPAGQGGNIPASSVTNVAVTLAGDQTITGKKTFPYGTVGGTQTNCPAFKTDSNDPYGPAFTITDVGVLGNPTLRVSGSFNDGETCTLVAGTLVNNLNSAVIRFGTNIPITNADVDVAFMNGTSSYQPAGYYWLDTSMLFNSGPTRDECIANGVAARYIHMFAKESTAPAGVYLGSLFLLEDTSKAPEFSNKTATIRIPTSTAIVNIQTIATYEGTGLPATVGTYGGLHTILATPVSGGVSGYTAEDVLLVFHGATYSAEDTATVKVKTVNGSGVVTELYTAAVVEGYGYDVRTPCVTYNTTNPAAVGCTVNVTAISAPVEPGTYTAAVKSSYLGPL